MEELVFCAAAAMVGAGFASGREIMRFFSLYGAYSWVLVCFASCLTAAMTRRMLGKGRENSPVGKGMLCLFYLTVGGGMTAAAGELWALTVPLPYARTMGSVITLAACLHLADGSLRGMAWLGKILLPLLLAVLVLCLRVPASGARRQAVSWAEGALALLSAAGYCGLNGMTASGVLSGSWHRKDPNKISLCVGLLTALLLFLGNAALLPHAETLNAAALPTVMLLRTYGKTGYYLAAAVLYLAASTTLIAVLRGLMTLTASYLPRHQKPLTGLCVLAVSLLGFGEIVGTAYPVLGWAYLIMLFAPRECIAQGKEPEKRL